ncbi:MAG: HAD family hydrolase [Pyrinomonadaceae bacterium]
MRNLSILLVVMLCSSCPRLPPAEIPDAVPKQAPAVVFDIDGTLTPKVSAVFEARTDAAKAVRIFADNGYKIIYVSTRISWLQAGIPSWLKEHGFPEGSIHVAQTDEEDDHPDEFKTRILKGFIDHGWDIRFGYGDSSTDFKAYAAVGIPKERVFALLRDGDTSCQSGEWKACLNGWTEHLEFVTKSVR